MQVDKPRSVEPARPRQTARTPALQTTELPRMAVTPLPRSPVWAEVAISVATALTTSWVRRPRRYGRHRHRQPHDVPGRAAAHVTAKRAT